MKIVHVYPTFANFGGAESVILTLHHNLSEDFDSYLSSFQAYEEIDEVFKEKVSRKKYLPLRITELLKLRKSIIISHDRKMTSFLVFLNIFLDFKLIHVAHGVYKSWKYLSFFPKSIVAVSYAVKNNLQEFFKIPHKNIVVIYNGVKDLLEKPQRIKYQAGSEVNVLFLGRIDNNKQQLKLVEGLKNDLNPNVKVDFAGDGIDAENLKSLITNCGLDINLRYIGFQTNVSDLILKYHYVMLFSKMEGLGISLIEACMLNRPIIAKVNNGSEACGEICYDGYNGFEANTIDDVKNLFNCLNEYSEDYYHSLCSNARNIYEEKFTLEDMILKYSSYLKDVCEVKIG